MGKLNMIPAILIGCLATIVSGVPDIIYGKPGGLMQLSQPSSSAVSPTVAQPQESNANELLTGAETGYGPYGAHAYGNHHGHGHHGGLGGGGGGGDLAVVVTGGYKVAADAPHHGIQHGLGGPHSHHAPQALGYGGHIQGGHGIGVPLGGHIQGGHGVSSLGGHIQEGHGAPIGHGHIPVIEHEHGNIGNYEYNGGHHYLPQVHHGHGHGHGHGHSNHHGHGIGGHYGHHQGHHHRGYGYGLHVPSHGVIGHHGHHRGYGHHHGHHHGQGGFKPILAPVSHGYGYGHHQLRHHHGLEHGVGQHHHHLQGHGVHGGALGGGGGHGHGHGAGILGHGGLSYVG